MSDNFRRVFSNYCLSGLVITLSLPVVAQPVEEIIITGVKDTSIVRTEDTLVAPPDTASLLKKMPGANVNKNGELTGIAQYRGMYGDRLNISINGAHVTSGGPNAMDAPLHYAPVALLESLTIHRGIVPVSQGQETIGGHVEAVTYSGDFGQSNDFEFSSRVYVGAQSVNDGNVGSVLLSLANQHHIIRAAVMREVGDDSEFNGGTITPSEYERERADLGYSFTTGAHEFSIDFAHNETGDAGTAALPMDIAAVDSNLLRSKYLWRGNDLTLTAKVSVNEIEHVMSNFHLRRPPQMPDMTPNLMRYRETLATSDNSGFLLQLEQNTAKGSIWRYGIDGHFSEHDADVTNPNMAMFKIVNYNDVERNILGAFLETERALSEAMSLEAGLRVNQVEMDSGHVQATGMPTMMNNMADMLAARFNSQDLSKSDTNLDWFARLNLQANNDLTWYLGVARKTRSASYQERYLWLPMESTGGLADGKTYVGNINLKPEVSHEVELGFDWEGGIASKPFSLYPRVFYKDVKDYIQGTPSSDMQVNMFGQMMANMGMGVGVPLQFNNVDAELYGVDLESKLSLNDHFSLRALLSTVRGKRNDIQDNLYRITPNNVLLALDYSAHNWSASLETIGYEKQDKVSQTNLEQATAGYALVNASAKVTLSQGLELGFGINNVFDRGYKDHLAGYNRAYNPDLAQRERLPGLGRNIYGRLVWVF